MHVEGAHLLGPVLQWGLGRHVIIVAWCMHVIIVALCMHVIIVAWCRHVIHQKLRKNRRASRGSVPEIGGFGACNRHVIILACHRHAIHQIRQDNLHASSGSVLKGRAFWGPAKARILAVCA